MSKNISGLQISVSNKVSQADYNNDQLIINGNIQDLKDAITSLGGEVGDNASLGAQITSINKQIDGINSNIAKQSDLISTNTNNITSLQQKDEQLLSSIQSLENEIDILTVITLPQTYVTKDELTTNINTINSLQERAGQQEATINSQQDQINVLQQSNSTLSAGIAELQRTIESLQNTITELQQRITALEQNKNEEV